MIELNFIIFHAKNGMLFACFKVWKFVKEKVMQLNKLIISLSLSLFLSGFAQAEYVKTDFASQGDNLAITDTVTGLTFLSLTETTGLSALDISSMQGAGGYFEGFSIASFDIMQYFQESNFGQAYIDMFAFEVDGHYIPNATNILPGDYAARMSQGIEFIDTFGQTFTTASGPRSYGLFSARDGSPSNYLLSGVDVNSQTANAGSLAFINHYDSSYGTAYDGTRQLSNYAYWMVSDSTVSNYYAELNAQESNASSDVSAPVSAMMLSILGIAFIRRRK